MATETMGATPARMRNCIHRHMVSPSPKSVIIRMMSDERLANPAGLLRIVTGEMAYGLHSGVSCLREMFALDGSRWPRLGRLEWAFVLIALVAAGLRLWELDGRVMHYDEAIHLHYAWKLARGVEFLHSPWMHGPLQIEMVAIVLRVLGDTDFVARLPYALFGVVLVVLPYFLRRQIGDMGAICAGVILTFSPSLLYFSRFGRNDILMVVWAVLLLIFLWRYTESSRRRLFVWSRSGYGADAGDERDRIFRDPVHGDSRRLGLGWRELWAVGATQRCRWLTCGERRDFLCCWRR